MKTAQLAQNLTGADSEMRILPAGVFRTKDGRPEGLPGWQIDTAIAASVIAASLGGADILIDYDHQSLRAASNGHPVPAAGWFNRLEWREGLGMFALGIQWNDKAKGMIAAREYRYISPVFSFDATTGNVLRILSVAITNEPALPELADLNPVAVNSSGLTMHRELADPQNHNGMDLLRRMGDENMKTTARLSAKSQQNVTRPYEALCAADASPCNHTSCELAASPCNQRGMELLERMTIGR